MANRLFALSCDEALGNITKALKVFDTYYIPVEEILEMQDLDVFLEKANEKFQMRFITALEARDNEKNGACYEFKTK